MTKKYLTIKEVANLLGVTPLTLRNWDKAGKLKAHKIGKEFRIDKKEFQRFLDKTKTK